MGSPIDSWEGATAIFTGAGGVTPMLFLILSVIICVGLIIHGAMHEEDAYKKHE
ncbi:MAG: hypothetical protein AAF334_08100 [Pseudomonadota bacterium]